MVEKTKIFKVNFKGYALLFYRWAEGTQGGSQHLIFTWRQENGISRTRDPLKLARREGHQKWPKMAQIGRKSQKFQFDEFIW